jgi:diketogulonate reductase-like aldo/keto reductase/histidinol phosphatase-like enzyme
MRRPKGDWVPDGRAKHLLESCDASREALAVETIDLYQLHVVDPRTPLETSVRALARLQQVGKVRDIGLCNVTVNQIRAAQAIVPVAAVQVSFSPFDDENLRNGVAEYCAEQGIRLIAYRPLGGDRVKRLARDETLARIAKRYGVTEPEVALAWLMSFAADIVPIPGATRVETAASLERVRALALASEDRALLDARFSGRLLRVPRAERRPRKTADGEVVLVMGMPGAGKTSVAEAMVASGFERLNRDAQGGSLADLLTPLDDLLASGQHRVVLDNTYATRKSRNEVIEAAWARGVPVRCVWLTTSIADAQINSIRRMLEVHGSLPSPNDIRRLGKTDPRYLLPDAQFRYERIVEPPSLDEGFTTIECRDFARAPDVGEATAVILDFDDLVNGPAPPLRPDDVHVDAGRLEALQRLRREGHFLFVHAWRPQIERGETAREEVDVCFARLRELLGNLDASCCPHDAGPPVCWCRKPIPGTVLEFAFRRRIALTRSLVMGSSAADRLMAERIGARFVGS